MLSFLPSSQFPSQTVFNLLYNSYRELIEDPSLHVKEEFIADLKKFDEEVAEHPQIAHCTFITCLDNKPIGLFSFDPRNCPAYGIIGHNCVLPEYKGQGYGIKQVEEMIKIFRERDCKKIIVSTGDHPFFIPAQKMYLRCGFKEAGITDEEKHGYKMIKYEMDLL
jgi:GNAT superfamily N-acetyltransferase